jgi:tetratricopeptide (TPR) repeat protein
MSTFSTSAGTDEACGICLEPIVGAYELDCAHTFCRGCINAYKKYGVNDVCPYCRTPLPPGADYSLDQCYQMEARMKRYEIEGHLKKFKIAHRLQLHHAQKAVKADPNIAVAHFFLALGLRHVNNDSEGAIAAYHEAIRCDPDSTEFNAHHNLGNLLKDARKDVDGAEREYRKAIRCFPNYVGAHFKLGELLHTVRKDYDGAEREYRKAIRCDPDDADTHSNLGILLKDVRKDYDGAEHEYREALRCDPSHANAHCNLGGLLHTVRKDYDGAEREYLEAIRCEPNFTDAYCNLGSLLYTNRRDFAGAERAFREAVRCDPNHARARDALQAVRRRRAADAETHGARASAARAVCAGELRVGAGVVLVGLAAAELNGARGTVVGGCKDGRWGVKLAARGGKAVAVKTANLQVRELPYPKK